MCWRVEKACDRFAYGKQGSKIRWSQDWAMDVQWRNERKYQAGGWIHLSNWNIYGKRILILLSITQHKRHSDVFVTHCFPLSFTSVFSGDDWHDWHLTLRVGTLFHCEESVEADNFSFFFSKAKGWIRLGGLGYMMISRVGASGESLCGMECVCLFFWLLESHFVCCLLFSVSYFHFSSWCFLLVITSLRLNPTLFTTFFN